MKKGLAIALVLALAGCSQGLDGIYRDAMGVSSYRFQRDGRVSIDVAGVQRQARYQREGDTLRIFLTEAEPALEFSLAPDGSLSGPLGVRLDKAKD